MDEQDTQKILMGWWQKKLSLTGWKNRIDKAERRILNQTQQEGEDWCCYLVNGLFLTVSLSDFFGGFGRKKRQFEPGNRTTLLNQLILETKGLHIFGKIKIMNSWNKQVTQRKITKTKLGKIKVIKTDLM